MCCKSVNIYQHLKASFGTSENQKHVVFYDFDVYIYICKKYEIK